MISLYFDENISEYVAEALNLLIKNHYTEITVYSTKIVFGKGVKDPVLIPEIAKQNGILFTFDTNMRRIQAESHLLASHTIGVIFLKLPDGQNNHWDKVRFLINKWEDIVNVIMKNKTLPFAYMVTPKSIKRL